MTGISDIDEWDDPGDLDALNKWADWADYKIILETKREIRELKDRVDLLLDSEKEKNIMTPEISDLIAKLLKMESELETLENLQTDS